MAELRGSQGAGERVFAAVRQYVLIPASGHSRFANGSADLLVAYALAD